MINGGFGETHINSILAALNIPSITQKALKKREREVGHQLNSMLEESCKKQLNKELCIENVIKNALYLAQILEGYMLK